MSVLSASPLPGATITVLYDEDAAGAAEALLAVLRRPAAHYESDSEPRETEEIAA